MFHSNTETLIDYWRARKGSRGAPARADIDPAQFPGLLAQVFIAGQGDAGAWPLRLAGEMLVEVHGAGLRGADLIGLWAPGYRAPLQRALEAALRAPDLLVINAEASAREGDIRRLEILFAPLLGPSGAPDRFLGLYQPLGASAGFGARPLGELRMRAIGGAGHAAPAPGLRLAAVDWRQIA
jgi:hypothetical protein